MGPKRREMTWAGIVLLIVAWGSTFAAIKIGLESAPPVTFAGLRSVIGGVVMVGLAALREGGPQLRRAWPVYAILCLLNVILFFGLQTVAVHMLTSGTAAVLIYLQPVLVGFLAWPLLGEHLSRVKLMGLVLGFLGIVAVSTGAFSGETDPVGVVVAVTAALIWAFGTIYFKRAQDEVPVFWAVGIPFVVGGTLLTLLGVVVESPDLAWTGRFFGSLLYASLVGTALAWGLWFSLVRAGEASRASAYIFFVPLVAIAGGAVVLGEPLRPSLLVGAALVVAGIYLVNRHPSPDT